jgi:phosphatidylethanolamine/phosphatidyl-N-methylethanolamine N-methyltransferase
MALFDRENPKFTADVSAQALSGTVVENDFVGRVYEKLSGVYDLTFGPLLHPGRLYAKDRLGIQPGDRVLEVGVGTGINMSLYPGDCHLLGVVVGDGARARHAARHRHPADEDGRAGDDVCR